MKETKNADDLVLLYSFCFCIRVKVRSKDLKTKKGSETRLLVS